ncbi:MAG: hypothetical protein M3Y86_07035 [Verrucomicrobiota bacterium]|nr:hypothetical protein [Verrucomicrobiota bacterium]
MWRFLQNPSLPADIIRACWALFCLVWLLAAISNKRSVYRESGARRLRYCSLSPFSF